MSDLRDRLQSALGAAYRIDRDLRGGGMSRVFVAEDVALGRQVVVKVLPPELAAGVNVDRFRREIQLAARLQHPHIVPLLSAGAADGLLWYTMPFIRGESLRLRLAQHGAMTIDDTIAILRDVVDGLSYAHLEGVVHRDVKPDNILLQGDHALVVDFGVAKALSDATGDGSLTSTGVTIGTPAYMAPEQISAETNVDHRADIYAIGVVAYEMLTGRSPFAGGSQQAIIAAHMTKAPERISEQRATVPPALEELIMRSLEKNPADRWQSAREMRALLDTLRSPSAEPVAAMHRLPGVAARAATSPSARQEVKREAEPAGPRRRYPLRYVAAAGIVVAIVAGALFYGRIRESRSTERAADSNGPSDSVSSVAVLPFVNISGSKDNEYFSDGMTEELISTLAKIQGLRVAARTSSFAFKGREQDIRSIAQQLGVTNVVEGSVRRAGDRFRVTAQLINARNGYHLWSDTFDGNLTDVFAVQDSISRFIAGALAG